MNTKLNAVVVDDEPMARKRLNRMLVASGAVDVLGEASNGREAIALIETLQPDIAFLDVQMPDLDGIEVARRLPEATRVVFTTAHSEHALTAFELSAVDYLLKPFGPARLMRTVERLSRKHHDPDYGTRIAQAMSSSATGRIFVRSGNRILPVAKNSIQYCVARKDYVQIVTTENKHILHLTMRALERELGQESFRRVHRSYIVNLEQVERFDPTTSDRYEAVLRNGVRVPVSRSQSRIIRRQGI